MKSVFFWIPSARFLSSWAFHNRLDDIYCWCESQGAYNDDVVGLVLPVRCWNWQD